MKARDMLSLAALAALVQACAEPIASPEHADNRFTSNQGFVVDPPDVPAVRIDLPSVARPWDTGDSALMGAIRAEGGYAVVAFKEPASSRVAQSGGLRAFVPRGAIVAGLALLEQAGATIIDYFPGIGAALVRIDPSVAPELRNLTVVDFVEPRQRVESREISASGWSSGTREAPEATLAQSVPWGISIVRAPEAWPLSTGENVKVGLIGQIVEKPHEDLPNYSCANYGGRYASSCGVLYAGIYPQGTFYAGITMARNNSLGVVGVAPGIPAANTYVWAGCDPSYTCYLDDLYPGYDFMRVAGVRVVLDAFFHADYDYGYAVAIAQAHAAGMIVVTGAGSSSSQFYPGTYTDVVGVAGIRSDTTFAATSPCGGSSNSGSHVDLAAPYWARSTVNIFAYQDETQGWCGSAIAAAHVAGAAAVVWSRYPTWSADSVRQRLFHTAYDRGPTGWDAQYGHGLLDVAGALGVARSLPPPPPPPPPTVDIIGYDLVLPGYICLWQANASGGTPPYTASWFVDNNPVGDGSLFLWYANSGASFEIRVEIRDAYGVPGSNMFYVTVSGEAGECPAY